MPDPSGVSSTQASAGWGRVGRRLLSPLALIAGGLVLFLAGNLTASIMGGTWAKPSTTCIDATRVPGTSGPDLQRVDLSGTTLAGVSLCGANLRGARLEGTCLRGAQLDGADLTGAVLTGADMTDTSALGAVGLPTPVPSATMACVAKK